MTTTVFVRKAADYNTPKAGPRVTEPLLAAARTADTSDATVVDVQLGRPLAWYDEPGSLELDGVLDRLSPGDVAVLRSLRSIADDPHAAVGAVRAMVGKGVRCIVHDLGGDVLPHLTALSALLAMSSDYEARVIEAEQQAERAEQTAAENANWVMKELISDLMRSGKVGISAPSMPAADAEPDAPEVAQRLRELRKAAGYTQRQLSESLDCEQSSIARAERNGRGEVAARAIAYLEPLVAEPDAEAA